MAATLHDTRLIPRVAYSLHRGETDHAYEQEVVAKLEPHTEWPER